MTQKKGVKTCNLDNCHSLINTDKHWQINSTTLTIRSIEQLNAKQRDRMKDSHKDGRIRHGENWLERTRIRTPVPDFKATKHLPRITLYSSASRRSSITSAVGNGLAFDFSGILLSDIRTVLPDFLPLQTINFTCNDHVIVALSSRLHTDQDRRSLFLFSVFF